MNQEKVDELLLQWERSHGSLPPEDLCRDDPNLLPVVQEAIDELRQIEALLDLENNQDEPEPDRPYPNVPNYKLEKRLGEGGNGEVYLARHVDLPNIERAIKVLRTRAFFQEEQAQRFADEVEILMGLKHPNILQSYDARLSTSPPYLVLEYVPKGSLADHLGEFQGQPEFVVRLMTKVAQAIHQAHSAGFIHRDLKPGNILLGENNEPLVADFGLARIRDFPPIVNTAANEENLEASWSFESATVTLQTWNEPTRAVEGTLLYMAPEQITGDREAIGPPTDVWAMGVVMCQVITGAHPLIDGSPDKLSFSDVCKAITEAVPEPLPKTLLGGDRRHRLEKIIHKCLAKSPTDRYPTAEVFAEDLQAWIFDEDLVADPPSVMNRMCQQACNSRWAIPILSLIAMTLAFLILSALWPTN
ncbi:MAG: serine/threonine-protein kinase [Gemmataceae bacterium]